MLKLTKRLSGLVYIPEIQINIIYKKVVLSLKKLSLSLKRILKTKNLSYRLKKQG